MGQRGFFRDDEVLSQFLFDATDDGLLTINGNPNGTPSGQFSTWYGPHLLVPATAIAGDFDNDGDVDGADFLAWQRDPSLGDLAAWQTNFGTSLAADTTSIPEPITLALALWAVPLLTHRRNQKRSWRR